MRNILLAVFMAFAFSFSVKSQTIVTFYTNYGVFETELFDTIVPITTSNFLGLVNSQGYDGKRFYRVISNFVIQGGYRTGLPPNIQDEFDSTGTLRNRRMTLSVANAGPNTGGSEFFINLKDNLFLDYDNPPLSSAHPVFGQVVKGINVVDSIGLVPTNASDGPISPVIMDSLRVTGSSLSQTEIATRQTRSAVYPNPISQESILDLYNARGGKASLTLINSAGSTIFQTEMMVNEGKTRIPLYELGVDPLKPGYYLLVVKINDQEQSFRLSKNE